MGHHDQSSEWCETASAPCCRPVAHSMNTLLPAPAWGTMRSGCVRAPQHRRDDLNEAPFGFVGGPWGSVPRDSGRPRLRRWRVTATGRRASRRTPIATLILLAHRAPADRAERRGARRQYLSHPFPPATILITHVASGGCQAAISSSGRACQALPLDAESPRRAVSQPPPATSPAKHTPIAVDSPTGPRVSDV
jgi:hypothetical protein